MTVETESGGEPIVRSGPYNGDGVTTVFDYDFPIQAAAELRVVRLNVDATTTDLTLTSQYTVAGVGVDAGGQITLVDPATDLPTGTQLLILYDGDFLQDVDWSNQGKIQLSLLEAQLDKQMMHMRQLKEQMTRALLAGEFSGGALYTLPDPVADGFLRWNPAGDALISSSFAFTDVELTDAGTDNRILRTNGVAGDAIQGSLATLSDLGDLSGIRALIMSGDLTVGASNIYFNSDSNKHLWFRDADGTTNRALFYVQQSSGIFFAQVYDGGGSVTAALQVRPADGSVNVAPGNLGVNVGTPGVGLDVSGKTDGIAAARGTTAQRPAHSAGRFRWNSDLGVMEASNGSAWKYMTPIEQVYTANNTATSHTFTSIPAGVDEIEIIFRDQLNNGTGSTTRVQIGTGGVLATSGYVSRSREAVTSGTANSTGNFSINRSGGSTAGLNGVMHLRREAGTNTWVASWNLVTDTPNHIIGGGRVTLGGALDVLNVSSGSGNLVSGSVTIRYR